MNNWQKQVLNSWPRNVDMPTQITDKIAVVKGKKVYLAKNGKPYIKRNNRSIWLVDNYQLEDSIFKSPEYWFFLFVFNTIFSIFYFYNYNDVLGFLGLALAGVCIACFFISLI